MSRPARPTSAARLTRPVRRAVLVVHIASAGGWLGMDLVLAVLAVRAWSSESPAERAVSMQALELFGVVPMISLAVTCLVTGVVLGLGTPYGLVRYWWVAVKLVINLVFTVLLVVALRPGLREAAGQGRDLAAGTVGATLDGTMMFPVVVSLSGLTVAMVLSVFKPWGRIRSRPRPAGERLGGRQRVDVSGGPW